MRYSEKVLNHFYHPKNVGSFSPHEEGVLRAKVGNYENGAVVQLEIKIINNIIIAARFKAYGPCLIIAGCSFTTDWLINKTIAEAKQFSSLLLIEELGFPEMKLYCALLIEDALKAMLVACY